MRRIDAARCSQDMRTGQIGIIGHWRRGSGLPIAALDTIIRAPTSRPIEGQTQPRSGVPAWTRQLQLTDRSRRRHGVTFDKLIFEENGCIRRIRGE